MTSDIDSIHWHLAKSESPKCTSLQSGPQLKRRLSSTVSALEPELLFLYRFFDILYSPYIEIGMQDRSHSDWRGPSLRTARIESRIN